MSKYSFVTEEGIELETKEQLLEFAAALLREDIVFENPNEFADALLNEEPEEPVKDIPLADIPGSSPRFIVTEGEQMMRATYYEDSEDFLEHIDNAFIMLYDNLDNKWNEATNTYLDVHTTEEFDLTTYNLKQEVRQAKDALVTAKMFVKKALTNHLMIK